MKKLLTVLMMCFAVFAVNAQISFWEEGFESGIPSTWSNVDADGDGNQWFAYGPGISTNPSHSGAQCAASASWTSGVALTPDNWLVTPAITVPAAGTTPTLSWWSAAQDPDYPDDHYEVYISTTGATPADFTSASIYSETLSSDTWENHTYDLSSYAGQTIYVAFRHFQSTDVFYMKLDDIAVMYTPTEPAVVANPTTVDLGNVIIGNNANSTVTVNAASLTSAITATTTAPFAVSADGTTFGTSASLASNGGTLYIQFAPTQGGAATGTVSLTSGTATCSVALTGNGIDCSVEGTIPYTEGFEYAGELPGCFTFVYGDNNPSVNTIAAAEGETGYGIAFSSYSQTSPYDQYMISPALHYNGTAELEFSIRATSTGYAAETFALGYSTTTADVNDFTWSETYSVSGTTYNTYNMVIPANAQYVAVHYFSNYMYYMYVDNLSVTELEPEIRVSSNTVDFGNIPAGSEVSQNVTVTGIMLDEAITATTAAPFAVSADGTTFGTTVTMPTAGGTLYVKYAPTTANTDNGTVTLTSGTLSATIALSGVAADCSVAATLPFTEDFEGGVFPPECWMIVSNNEVTWEAYFNEGTSSNAANCSYAEDAQDESLITKTLDFSGVTGNITLSFDFAASYNFIQNPDPDEQYNLLIFASTDNGATFSTTPLYDMRADQGEFEDWADERSIDIDLSSLAGEANVKLNFNYVGTYGAQLIIDNILIENSTVGIEENEASSVRVFPNPATNMINVEAQGYEQYQLVNMLGQTVSSNSLNNGTAQINVSNLSNGVYFVRLINGNNVETIKVVKK